jgi:hypothetical protein
MTSHRGLPRCIYQGYVPNVVDSKMPLHLSPLRKLEKHQQHWGHNLYQRCSFCKVAATPPKIVPTFRVLRRVGGLQCKHRGIKPERD